MKKAIIIIVIIAIVIFLAGIILHSRHQQLPKAISINTSNQPTLGQDTAKIHIVAFEDLKCIACKQFSTTIFPQIKTNYIDKGIAKFTFINLAFIPGSMPAANAARCLYQQDPKLFFPFIEYIYAHQPSENEDWATIPKLAEFAGHIHGADQNKLSQCIYDSPHNQLINNNFNLAEKAIGRKVITPSVFINGIRVEPLTYEQVEKIIKMHPSM